MILKASQRGGAKQLAQHLMRTDENEHVEVHDVRGFVSEDLPGALNEAYAVSRGTRCRQFLFSVSLNPPQTERVDIAAFEDALVRIETRTGLSGQPRVVVFHEKEGRRHAHAVWSRIDAETMTARNLPHFKLKLRDISRDLYLEHGWTMPRGLMNSRERDPRNYTLAEWQQARRKGHDARELKATVQECWAVSDSRAAFTQALKERGLTLARGDRRGHVAVTHDGDVLSVARFTGKTAREVRARLGKPDDLPGVEEAKRQIAAGMLPALERYLSSLRTRQEREAAPLEAQRLALSHRHREERERLDRAQAERWTRETRARSDRLNAGLRGILDRVTGRHARTMRENLAEAHAALQRDRAQRQTLIEAQLGDHQALQARLRDVRSRHGREMRALYGDRERYREQARPAPENRVERETTLPAAEPKIKSAFERLASMRQPDPPQRTEPACGSAPRPPTADDRLRALRAGKSRTAPTRDRGPEPER
jgi:hypothetical protein